MRRILVLIMMPFLLEACARSSECHKEIGIDKKPPAVVVVFLKKNLSDHYLVDRQECLDQVYWLAIPKSEPHDRPRSPGVEKLIVLDRKKNTVEVVAGE